MGRARNDAARDEPGQIRSLCGDGATIFFRTDKLLKSAKVIHTARFNFLREAQIWYNRNRNEVPLSACFENVIVLSDEFYNELMSPPSPSTGTGKSVMDLDAVRVLHAAPGVLDFFVWLGYRCFTARGDEQIPLFGTFGLARQLGIYLRAGRVNSPAR